MVIKNVITTLYLFSSVFLLLWMISTLMFGRTTLKFLKRKLLEEGYNTPWWDQNGWGFRVSIYAFLLVKGKPYKHSTKEDFIVLEVARTYDRVLAHISVYSFFIAMIPGIYLTFFVDNI